MGKHQRAAAVLQAHLAADRQFQTGRVARCWLLRVPAAARGARAHTLPCLTHSLAEAPIGAVADLPREGVHTGAAGRQQAVRRRRGKRCKNAGGRGRTPLAAGAACLPRCPVARAPRHTVSVG